MTTRWFCHDCPAHGETTGTEAGADAKHARSAGHCTSTTTQNTQVSAANRTPVRGKIQGTMRPRIRANGPGPTDQHLEE